MRALVLFYILVIYVIVQFSWWAYLLVDLNQEVYDLKVAVLIAENGGKELDESHVYLTELEKRWAMVAGEGMVFLSLLIVGIYKTRQSFRKEYSLARQQKNFLLSITHEFKSPLAAVKLNLQTLQKRSLSKEQTVSVLSNAIYETDRINNLVENALIATRLDSKNMELQNFELDLSDSVRSVLRSFEMTSGKHIKFDTAIQDEICINGDQVAINSLISNLIENAIKYSPIDPYISITLESKGDIVLFRVGDNGVGVSDQEKAVIFEKFYRSGNEETRSTKGTGLGLFIVKHVVDLHKGKIHVYDNMPKGTIFEVTLPAIQIES